MCASLHSSELLLVSCRIHVLVCPIFTGVSIMLACTSVELTLWTGRINGYIIMEMPSCDGSLGCQNVYIILWALHLHCIIVSRNISCACCCTEILRLIITAHTSWRAVFTAHRAKSRLDLVSTLIKAIVAFVATVDLIPIVFATSVFPAAITFAIPYVDVRPIARCA